MHHTNFTYECLADRLSNILTKLNIRYQLGIKELAAEFGVSICTISSDFDRLNSYLPFLRDDEMKKLYLGSNYLGKIASQDIHNFAQLSGISNLYPSLYMSFLCGLLDSRAHYIYSAKGHSFKGISQFKELFKVLGKKFKNIAKWAFYIKGNVDWFSLIVFRVFNLCTLYMNILNLFQIRIL